MYLAQTVTSQTCKGNYIIEPMCYVLHVIFSPNSCCTIPDLIVEIEIEILLFIEWKVIQKFNRDEEVQRRTYVHPGILHIY